MIRVKRILADYLDFILIIIFSSNINDILIKIVDINWTIILSFLLLIVRDLCFKNKSLFKKILKIEVVDIDNNIPSKIKLVLRNLLSLNIFNYILILIKGNGIEDFIFHTKIVSTGDMKIPKSKILTFINYSVIIVVLILTMIIETIIKGVFIDTGYYNIMDITIPDECSHIYRYIHQNDFLKNRRRYAIYQCDENVDFSNSQLIKLESGKNELLEEKINIVVDLFKNIDDFDISQDHFLINFNNDYAYYEKSDISDIYVIYDKIEYKMYIIENTK